MIRRFYSLISLGIAAVLGTALFLTSEQVQHTEKELAVVLENVSVEQDALRVLNAEWAYLNRPDRLEELSTTYLKLTPATANQLASTVDVLPNVFTPILPGTKPDAIPAAYVQANRVSMPTAVASAPAPIHKKNKMPPRFDQLMKNLTTDHTTTDPRTP